ncbi:MULTISPECIES: bifunctional glycosyltransferase family 2 protein/CDP-glycerol:glycerophosphate glycerophosphotransferase [unclassified Streptomyces]|uniref:bifunctional glycosyltransferase/CDP-glycerol:glycerophosphate glycerophosphotransferase n=1 Tax=unclassified Streptomyces TaxID=2593676 RepID=UPI0022597A9F|nr:MULTISPECIES: bifunctional glycosyltransferase family 2 protein/CDP-glycerol:glycerophosphate glycerophosphotransferase [unclassified Streptomyces]MCX5140221.1 bifunctional glycosyltransferase family 2 protein/CDP-glycerol:glycerophosphate glycerophosphotransferase [Streptomyces sp. NBC_00338]WRZ64810.1 bifunctional glycosyltransferase family 2 protein/CDP-glycerol:glycerophosphate glycerophosphotransferase [Streptomyces sp. NBC_01257]WSU58791.1 bifunctional glycosyltransferase family 2 prote
MPRLTLIVPAYNVQGYVRECLDSVLQQDFTDFEVVAVDDCSPDASGAILDEYAGRDARVRVLHLSENVGLGHARNAGIEQATGDYLLFLDSDDTLTPGSLSAIAGRLDATDDPDVLIYDYTRSYWDGRLLPNQRADLLARSEPAVFPLSERPELLDLLQIVWNKAYRRDFVEAHGFQFPTGYYEDAPWTYSTLITAESIAVLDRVCVLYRQRREGGNILRTVSRKHFDVFDQYDRVFAYVDEHPELDSWRPALFRKMIDHYLTVMEKPGRLPKAARSEFFHRAAAEYTRRLPEGFERPGGGRGYKYALLGRDSYTGLTGVTRASRVRNRTRARNIERIGRAKRAAMRMIYQSQLRLPLDENLAVFSAYWSRGYSCNPAAIDAELARLAPHIRRVWAVRAEHVSRVPKGVEVVVVGSREYWTALARGTYFINNVNFADALVKREGQIHLQTHHGTPLKTMGLDQANYPASTNMDMEDLLRRCDRWDYSISSNRFSTSVWERVYPCTYTSLETGYPRNDVLINSGAREVAQARRELGAADGSKVFLYMPTHREYQKEFTPRIDLAKLAEELGPEVTLLVRGHYFYKPTGRLAELQASGRVIDVSAHQNVEQLYLAADALITDYSSAMFDYANLDRPIVIYADDWDTYKVVRGSYFDLMAEPPGAVATTQAQLTEILRSGEWQSEKSATFRSAFRERFCDFDDGHAAERVVRAVFLNEENVLPVVPLAARKPAPSPAQALELVERV